MSTCTTLVLLVCVIFQVSTPVGCEVCEVKNNYVYSCDSGYYCCGDICCSIRWTVIGSLFGAGVFFLIFGLIISAIHEKCTQPSTRVTPVQTEQGTEGGVAVRY